jgi:hypothetical protein
MVLPEGGGQTGTRKFRLLAGFEESNDALFLESSV